MFRSTVLRFPKTLFQSQTRSFFSSKKPPQNLLPKWALPTSSIVLIGLASYYLSQPLRLDPKAEALKPSKPKPSTISTSPAPVTSDEPKKESKKEVETKGDGGSEAKGDEESESKGEEEGEEKQQAAYNPDTGEINWDCPCLGGMAHGPCGEEFKEAFSCFVYSEAEPKGFDCIEKFKNMQNCFRKYPEIYSEEIRDDEGEPDNLEVESKSAPASSEKPGKAAVNKKRAEKSVKGSEPDATSSANGEETLE